ncbi:NAD(P)/FAD-dependent oxidoreductase [Amycolatopsis acidicola]|uniref:NAD(P)/FAD-dependent oxidoreductase n=1 Tax=Amycolatopsis acidicola TaxID=2596893 RepID=A0A5N0UMD4_9PSEU|nr:NAD(P)/FAD-dependent oxidoreductase [Amycolatopsis acidicola]KAA9148195.1 NAD(P)/FAD-dependent oxidoreductase [Amycolatopsis acidicola]
MPDAIVVGGGQSGLATAYVLRQAGLTPVLLEAGAEPVGSWPRYYESLTLFSPARYSSLPGKAFPGDPARYPHRDEVIDYLRDYAATLDVDIRTGTRVTSVRHDGDFEVHAGETFTAPMLIAATGAFGSPFQPSLPGLFTGRTLHAMDYREPSAFEGQRIVVVGAGNTAAQIGTELAGHARVTLATRKPVAFVTQRPLGQDLQFWFTVTGTGFLPIPSRQRNPPTVPVLDTGVYRRAVRAGKPDQRRMFTRVEGQRVTWPDGSAEDVDTIIFATGYRPDLGYLAGLGALDADGMPVQYKGLSTTHAGLGYVGLEWQRCLLSASLRGVGRDARYVVRKLRQ